jgi:hypothetical protein
MKIDSTYQSSFLQKIQKIKDETHTFFNFENLKKNIDEWSPYLNFVPKI